MAAETRSDGVNTNRDVYNVGELFYRRNNVRANETSNEVAIDVDRGAVQLAKSVDKTHAQPGDALVYEISAANVTDSPVAGIDIVVDGIPAMAFVLRDQVPANTRFDSAENLGGQQAQLLYHIAGEPLHQYLSQPPASNQIDAIAFAVESFAGGAEVRAELQIIINSNAAGTLRNIARGFSGDGDAGSNEVSTNLPERQGDVQFFNADNNASNNSKPVSRTSSGDDIGFAVDAAGCNTRSDVVEQYPLRVITRLSGDNEVFTAVETGPNTGYFEVQQGVPLRSTDQQAVQPGNDAIEADRGDELIASLEDCAAASPSESLLIDPLGVVFDSRSNLPIGGAIVTLIDVDGDGNGGNPGGPARVFEEDGTTPAPSTVTTGDDGAYQFPRVAPSRYRLQITPPNDYQFPSQVPPEELPGARIIDADGSYGREFIVSEETGARTIDVPLDLIANQLFVDLALSQTSVQPADIVLAEITISNRSDRDSEDTTVTIQPPAGFRIVPGSVRLNGEELIGFEGVYGVGVIGANSDTTVTFQLEALATASDGLVTSQASGVFMVGQQVASIGSNVARRPIKVISPLGESYVIGTVYLDCDSDFEQGPYEHGIPGVRLYLQDGSYTVTDEAGRFSVPGLRTGTHVLKLDATTVPVELTAKPIDFRHAGDGRSRFIDLKAGELHKANFTFFCTDKALQAVEKRIARAAKLLTNLRSAADQPLNAIDELTLAPEQALSRENRQRASVNGTSGSSANRAIGNVTAADASPDSVVANYRNVPEQFDVERWLEGQTKRLAFIDLQDGDLVPLKKVTVRLKASHRAELRLTVNGVRVGSDKIGQRAADTRSGVGYWEFVAVTLQQGDNLLLAEVVDSFGNVRQAESITLRLPGDPNKLVVSANAKQLVANASEPVNITIQALDENGLPANLNAPVTLQTSVGLWAIEDIDPVTPGLQLLLTQGRATAKLLPPVRAGKGKLQASVGTLTSSQTLEFSAKLRPMLAVGLIEGVIAFGKSSPMQRDRASQLFERELSALTDSADGERVQFGARAAVFMTGEVKGNALLTLRYDSEPNSDQLFRDIEPQRNYPIYGDTAERGFDARSTSQLFARLERDNNYIQYGDLVTDAESDAVKLGNVRRSLTGVQAHVDNNIVSATAFASRDSSEQQLDEIPAEGVSGPYQLTGSDIRGGSETVELITRDRDRPGTIINSQLQQRFTDYVLDPTSGELVFRRPINSVDRDLNPISIRVRYEVQSGGESYWVGGVQADVKVAKGVTIGGGWVRDNSPDGDVSRDVQNINAKILMSDNTSAEAEIARSDSGDGSAIGWRAAVQHRGEKLNVAADMGRVQEGFNNPASVIRAGREEARLRGGYKLNESQSVQLDALHSRDLSTDGERNDGVALSARQEFGQSSFELGARHTRRSATDTETNTTSIRGRAESRLPFVQREHSYFIEAEQAVNDSKRRLLAIGGNVQLHPQTQLYARHELASTNTGAFGLDESRSRHTSVVGLSSDYFDNGQVFSEYRAQNSISGREAEAAIGLRNQWQLTANSSFNIAAERISPIRGESGNARTALGFGFQFANAEKLSGTARLEWRETDSGYSWFNTLGIANRLSKNVSLLARNTLSIRRGTAKAVEDRLQFGLAWRDSKNDRIHGLLRYEWRLEDDDASRQQAHLWTTHLNWQPRRDVNVSASYGIRHVDTRAGSFTSSTDAQALFGRVNWRAFERIDIGLQAGVLGSSGFGRRNYGSGVELGYLLHTNLWLAAGFNFTGVDDADFGGSTSHKGSYLRLRFKFDENLFGSRL